MTTRLTGALCALALGLTAVAGAAGDSTDGRIVFVRWQPGAAGGIYTVNPDGSGLHQLNRSQGSTEAAPAWSPDRRRIAFQRSTQRLGYAIWVMNADGTGQRQLAADGNTPAWSPDSRRIVFSSGPLWIVNVDGTNRHRLAAVGNCADWSPDGRTIAFTLGATGVYTIHSDGTGQRQLATTGVCPRWFPDGRKIAYTLGKQGGSERVPIWVMNADGTGAHLVHALSEEDGNVDWSPDGGRLAFTYRGDIWTMSASGTGLRRVTSGPGGDSGLSWQ